MRRLLLVFICLLSGIPKPAQAVEAIVDRALFRHGDGSSYLELYWQINPTSIHYRKDSLGRLTSRIRTEIRISSGTDTALNEQYYLQTQPFNPQEQDAPATLEQTRVELAPGHYRIEILLTEEAYPQQKFAHRDTLTVTLLNAPEFSSIQLLDTFFASKDPGPFQKRGMQQLPRVLPFYDEGQFRLHAYSELYPTSELSAESYPLKRTFFISRQKGEGEKGIHSYSDSISSFTAISVNRQSIDIDDLPSGNYYLNLVLRDAHGLKLADRALFFQMLNKNPRQRTITATDSSKVVEQAGTVLDLSKTFVAKFDMAQMRAILKMILPTAEPSEVSAIKGFLERPDELYVRYFVYNHFHNINKDDPAKAWKDFSEKIKSVNRQFKVGGKMGYETDRGVIYLRYGEPAEVLRVPNEAGSFPYEIWRYYIGGKISGSGLFLFYSPGFMISDYSLLHSTVPGERNNPNWRATLYNTGTNPSGNSRAEEYFGK